MVQARNAPLALSRGDFQRLRRVHVNAPQDWGYRIGTDYWLIATANGMLTSTNAHELADYGWTTTSLAMADGSGADLISAADVGTPGQLTQDAQNDLLKSPAIFGDYAHAHAAMEILGERSLPRYLIGDMYCRFSVVANDQNTTNIGFVEDNGSIIVAADASATINSDGTNFRLNVNGTRATNTNNIAVTTNNIWIRLAYDVAQSLVFAWINGTLLASAAVVQDEFPVCFGAGSGGAANLVQLNQAHIFYAWRLPFDAGRI